MSNTNSTKHQCKLKREILSLKKELESTSSTKLGYTIEDMSSHDLMKLNHEVNRGATRHGNKRDYESDMKIKTRRSKRAKAKVDAEQMVQQYFYQNEYKYN
jgi:hypothetical protein